MLTNHVISGVLLGVILLPTVSLGAELRVGQPGRISSSTIDTSALDKGLCSNLETMRTAALAKVDERVITIVGKRDDRRGGVDSKRTERLQTLTEKRKEMDGKRSEHYTALRARASTTAQKAAVETFSTTVEELIATRKAAIDTAIKNFEDGVASLRPKVDTAVTDRKIQVKSDLHKIFDDAKAACSAGKNGQEVRSIMASGMDAMKTKRIDTKGEYNFKDDFEALRAARKAAEAKAISDFKSGYEAAKTNLKSAFAQ